MVLFPAFLFSQSAGDKNLPQPGKQSLKDVISSLYDSNSSSWIAEAGMYTTQHLP
jgi:hypothetical protein